MFESIGPIEPVPFMLADGTERKYSTGGVIRVKTKEGLITRFFAAYVPDYVCTIISLGTSQHLPLQLTTAN